MHPPLPGGVSFPDFVHLPAHTEYAMLDGAAKLKPLFAARAPRLLLQAADGSRTTRRTSCGIVAATDCPPGRCKSGLLGAGCLA
ncbi:MAG: hypothetical protein WCC38_14670 [Pseudonocardiaceae bacterium]